MANNPYVNKVEYAGKTIMDLTGDTVNPSSVLNGVTFHDRSGAPQTGSMITHNVYDGLDSTSADDALSAKQGKILNDKFKTVSSGSLHDIKSSGTYYITSAVTNKPVQDGGYYSLNAYNESLLVGIYCSIAGDVYVIKYSDNAWNTFRIAKYTEVQAIDTSVQTLSTSVQSLSTSVQTLNASVQTLNDKFKTVSSGSLHDIKSSGTYYITSAVTNKPVQDGGYYSLNAYNESLLVGIYCSIAGDVYVIKYSDNAWNTFRIAKYTEVQTVDTNKANKPVVIQATATTTSTGAFAVPTDVINGTFVSAWGSSSACFVYRRDPSYFMIRDVNMNPISNTQITINIAYIP